MPSTLRNHEVCGSPGDISLVFTTSVDTARRLCRLLQLFNGESLQDILGGRRPSGPSASEKRRRSLLHFGGPVVEMSRNVPAEDRDRLMEEAAEGRIAVIVATDNLARGIDLANLRLVINYDPPKVARTYVHRVGRTARAGRTGSAVTFLKSGQVGAFRKMRAQVGASSAQAQTSNSSNRRSSNAAFEKGRLPKCKPSKDTEAAVLPSYTRALKRLATALGLQNAGTVDIGE